MNNLAYKLKEKSKEIPDKICIIDKNQRVTYKELYEKVASFKKYLELKDVKPNDKILILVPMSVELYVTLFAVWSLGAIPCFMDAGFIKNGMINNEFEGINCIIGITKYLLYSNINKNLRKLKTKINVNVISNLELSDNLEIFEVSKDYSGILTYTSGTTRKPKISARTHEFLNFQDEILQDVIKYDKEDIQMSTMPIFTLINISSGITTVIMNGKFSNLGNSEPIGIIEQIKKESVTGISAAPGVFDVITRYCIKEKIKIDSVKKIHTGGGAVFLDFIDRIKNVFPNAIIETMYGSTEAEPISVFNINDMTEDDIEKTKNGYGILAGKIVGVDDCKIIKTGITEIGEITKQEFENLQQDIGEIVVTGKNVLKGYVGGIGDAENKFSVDGIKYHRTGDLGYIDDKERLWLRGRIKEPYFNIEAALHSRFKIGKTAVFKDNQEKIILVLENKVSEEDIKSAITFEKIDKIVYVDKIPVDKRHSTKVDYKELRKILKM